MPPSPSPSAHRAEIAPGVLLDSRRALVNPAKGWMAVADLHYGYEVHRRRQGALLPDWGTAQCAATLRALLHDHRPQRLILVGDIMDGSGSVSETGEFLDTLRCDGLDLVLIEGNHDRAALKKGWQFTDFHHEDGFVFHHGHLGIAPPSVMGHPTLADTELTLITGHQHPAISLRDGAGLSLKLPAFVQQRVSPQIHHWILPAFSPWAAGGIYTSEHERLSTWACSTTRVWRME